MMVRIERPTISASVYPNTRSAAAFQLVIVPSSDLAMIASSLDSTIAASRACASAIETPGVASGGVDCWASDGLGISPVVMSDRPIALHSVWSEAQPPAYVWGTALDIACCIPLAAALLV